MNDKGNFILKTNITPRELHEREFLQQHAIQPDIPEARQTTYASRASRIAHASHSAGTWIPPAHMSRPRSSEALLPMARMVPIAVH
jgi:hypothetical protein